jgi:hypothetical protein
MTIQGLWRAGATRLPCGFEAAAKSEGGGRRTRFPVQLASIVSSLAPAAHNPT